MTYNESALWPDIPPRRRSSTPMGILAATAIGAVMAVAAIPGLATPEPMVSAVPPPTPATAMPLVVPAAPVIAVEAAPLEAVAIAPPEPPPVPDVAKPAAPPQPTWTDADLTFAKGYAKRRSFFGHTGSGVKAPKTGKRVVTVKRNLRASQRRMATSETYRLRDGREVTVHRRYGENTNNDFGFRTW